MFLSFWYAEAKMYVYKVIILKYYSLLSSSEDIQDIKNSEVRKFMYSHHNNQKYSDATVDL